MHFTYMIKGGFYVLCTVCKTNADKCILGKFIKDLYKTV